MKNFNGFYSGREFESYCKRLEIENFEKYKKVLDIGSGFSTCVHKLLQQSKDAFALDLGYGNTDKMIATYFSQPMPSLIANKYPSAHLAKKDIMKKRQKHIVNFLDSKKQNPGRYLAADCFNLPFDKNTFDLAMNVESLGNKHYFSYEQFLQGIEEMTRVAKEVRIHSKYLHVFSSELENMLLKKALQWEQKKGLLIISPTFKS